MKWVPDNPLVKRRSPSAGEARKIAKKAASTRGSLPTSTNYYLHDPLFAESIHIGKTYAAAGGVGWTTDTSLSEGRWSGTASLIAYLEKLETEEGIALDADPRVLYTSWVASEYGDVMLPGKMAQKISAAIETSTMRIAFT